MVDRTDTDRVSRAPMKLVLGGEVREIRPLVLRKSREWKKKFAAILGEVTGITFDAEKAGTGASAEGLKEMVSTLALQVPDKLQDLVFDYLRLADPALRVDSLEDVATDTEITDALWTMLQVTFPFFWKVGDLVKLAGSLGK